MNIIVQRNDEEKVTGTIKGNAYNFRGDFFRIYGGYCIDKEVLERLKENKVENIVCQLRNGERIVTTLQEFMTEGIKHWTAGVQQICLPELKWKKEFANVS